MTAPTMRAAAPRRAPVPVRERGYALVAAVASIAVFASLSLSLLTATRATTTTAVAEIDRARAAAAADAGLALALHHLLAGGGGGGEWQADGIDREERFDDARLTIRVEDERGKVPLGRLDEDTAGRLLEHAGLSGDALLIARDSLLDWTDEDEDPRANGAEAAYYAPRGIAPRNGTPLSIEELADIRGFDAALVERLRDIVTVAGGQQGFDATHADPAAIDIMEGDEGAIDAIERKRELAGAHPAQAFSTADDTLVGRPITLVVQAELPDGARMVRREMVELTGAPLRPYTVLSYE